MIYSVVMNKGFTKIGFFISSITPLFRVSSISIVNDDRSTSSIKTQPSPVKTNTLKMCTGKFRNFNNDVERDQAISIMLHLRLV